jgi:hypothetical protein
MSVSYGGDSIVFADGSVNSSGFIGHRNRIINGAMVVDQRNAGGTVSSHLSFPVDRMQIVKDTSSGTFTMGQSSVVPSLGGFNKSILFTVGTAYTPSSTENNFFKHLIEGYNVADLVWGTANATAVTLSFWVRSSITGTYGGSLRNGSSNRSYVFTYTINSANTFEYKTITIPGDTSGTWLTTNGNGLEISWGLSVGSTYSNSAGGWYSGNYISATGATQITPTAGATWYITGVQLERGSTASSFEYRSYGAELALCQRYYEIVASQTVYIDNGSADNARFYIPFKVTKRASPTVTSGTGNSEGGQSWSPGYSTSSIEGTVCATAFTATARPYINAPIVATAEL